MKFKKKDKEARNSSITSSATDPAKPKRKRRRDGIAGTILRGVVVRICFLLHSILYVWRVLDVTENPIYFALIGVQLISLIEAIITLTYKRTGWEW